jgi:hypothetical protein
MSCSWQVVSELHIVATINIIWSYKRWVAFGATHATYPIAFMA